MIDNQVQPPFETPQSDAVRQCVLSDFNDKPLNGQVRAEGTSFRRVLLPPTQQSMQYAELERRLRRYYEDRLVTDEDRNRDYLKQLRARDAAEQAASNAVAGARNPSALAIPDYSRIGQDLANVKPAPGADQLPANVGGAG